VISNFIATVIMVISLPFVVSGNYDVSTHLISCAIFIVVISKS